MNPYIKYTVSQDVMLKMSNSSNFDIAVGVMGSLFKSSLTYRIYAGTNRIKNGVVWYVTNSGNFGVATADNSRMFVGAELGYNPIGGLSLTAKLDAHKDDTTSEYLFDAPKFTAEFMAEYALKRWRFYTSANMMGEREWSCESGDTFKSEATIDLRAGVSFKAATKWKVYVDGYNLLNAKIYDYAYYYRNGMGVVAGVEIDF
jgi:hypothetical protein